MEMPSHLLLQHVLVSGFSLVWTLRTEQPQVSLEWWAAVPQGASLPSCSPPLPGGVYALSPPRRGRCGERAHAP